MIKGFSISVSPQNVNVDSFLEKEYDNLYLQSSQFDFLFEGVLLNKSKLLKEFALRDFETLILELYLLKKEQLVKQFEGEFRGFVFDKTEQKFYVFTNITSTQRVFYFRIKDQIFVDTSLIRLSQILKNNGLETEPDIESIYQLLSFSNLPERKTPIQQVNKLLDGHYLEISCENFVLEEKEYFTLLGTPIFKGSKDKALDNIHEVFKNSVLLEYEKDSEMGTDHLALLSGGLDSRVAMMYAIKNNFKIGNALCFSQSGYYDHTISEKIAKDFNIHYEFIPLDGGQFLKKIDKLTEISEGMVLYTGGIHVEHAMEKMQFENFGLFHSGQIGDGVLGGFNTEPRRKAPSYFKIVDSPKFLPKIQQSLDETLKKYETEELFLLRNVAYNRTLLGAHVLQQKRYQTSPFMTKDFLSLAISLPEEWKFNHRFYMDWIAKHCKEATQYRWERTLLKPNAKWKTAFGDQIIKRGFKILHERVLKMGHKSSMYPYEYYFNQDAQIQQYYEQYFNDNIHRLEKYPELLKDIEILFLADQFFLKAKAINILSIFKLYF